MWRAAPVVPVSPVVRVSATATKAALELAKDKINTDKLLFPDRELELVVRDDEEHGWTGVQSSCELVHAGVHAVVGPA